jgi:hypothetical protein
MHDDRIIINTANSANISIGTNILNSEFDEFKFNSRTNTNTKSKSKSKSEIDNFNSENFKIFLKDIKKNMAKCNYRRTLADIKLKEELFQNLEIKNLWKIKEAKVNAMLKIFEKKLYKSEFQKSQRQKSLENWMKKIDEIIENWLKNLILDQNNQEEIEALLTLILKQIYFDAIFRITENNFIEAIIILSTGEGIIKNFWQFSINPKFLNISQEILLLISNLIIADGNYEEGISYIKRVIKLCFMELINKIKIEDEINLNKIKDKYEYSKIFKNIVIAFYQKGMLEENSGRIKLSIDSYLQASWFSNNFLKNTNPEINNFTTDVYKRVSEYNNLIQFKLKENLQENTQEEIKEKKPLNIKLDLFFKNKQKTLKEKEKEISNFIETLNFQDFDFLEDELLTEKVRNILFTVILFNNFTSYEFKDILKENINVDKISKMDIEVVEKIQRRLNELKAEKTFLKIEEKKKKKKFIENAKRNFNDLNVYKNKNVYNAINVFKNKN